MTKIVYNATYGGFSLSDQAIRRYAEIKGIPLYPEPNRIARSLTTYWTVPKDQRPPDQEWAWHQMTPEERQASNAAHNAAQLCVSDIQRTDPALAQAVEELGDAANGEFAYLKIKDLPSGTRYRIDEYDGHETIVRADEEVWLIA